MSHVAVTLGLRTTLAWNTDLVDLWLQINAKALFDRGHDVLCQLPDFQTCPSPKMHEDERLLVVDPMGVPYCFSLVS